MGAQKIEGVHVYLYQSGTTMTNIYSSEAAAPMVQASRGKDNVMAEGDFACVREGGWKRGSTRVGGELTIKDRVEEGIQMTTTSEL